MIRLAALALYMLFVAGYAFRDWYVSLCGLIALLAVIEHPDMPKTLFGIQGLNPWNLLLVVVLLGWLVGRRRERLAWDMPAWAATMLLLYLAVVLVGFARMMADRQYLEDGPAYLVSEHLVNTVKWVIPAIMLYDGCRTRRRFLLGLGATLAIYFLLGLLVIKWMPASSIGSGEALSARSLKILSNEIGYHRVNLSVMLAGASWAILAARGLVRGRPLRLLVSAAALAVVYAQALTGGRTGYGTWMTIGLVLAALRWRRYLLAIPIVVIAVVTFLPAARDRMLEGFTAESHDSSAYLQNQNRDRNPDEPDDYTITAGRTLIWPFVLEKIRKAPFFGYGREAMKRTGLSAFLLQELGESFPHPHNAYLQWLLDNGIVGFVVVIPFYLTVVVVSASLFRDSRNEVFVAAGGAALALVLALLLGAFGSQTFYPREGAAGMWAAIALMLRAASERTRAVRLGQGRPVIRSGRVPERPIASAWALRRPAPAPGSLA
jgi:O-antigen ligase